MYTLNSLQYMMQTLGILRRFDIRHNATRSFLTV